MSYFVWPHPRTISRFGALALVFLIAGCTTTSERASRTPAELLQEGKHLLKIKEPLKAKEIFQQILEDYPDSQERVQALMFLADVHYWESEYQEAKFHYQKFIELYPTHQYADRAHYYSAMSDYKMMEIATRDQTHTQAALEGFNTLLRQFPNSKYAPRAKVKRKECVTTLARNVFEIGKFYFRTKAYQAAILRLQNLLQKYPDQEFLDEAIFLIGESYYSEENYDKARATYKELLKKYPRSLYVQDARERLKTLR
ncbi:MAG: outer membrane protein assembly factor BamD [Nitrospinaceae bacterium]|nr:outer membrane protein assembly factor BamD [Nitrospinaceae bacterium]NIR54111.1 outer membrane protein assembly factor BamD [Nitrospinaceae bacterium]NIS84531.1 outer membrane protein assembly factor BamD [Nitrospinaceae bacterium]NIT81323.1 outer membrane protein assembly factor BamD [Nitrospinaceae bacterium]NIU43612.1 outer membrane protein assembly factor BamD [Nitrospinaceae bacterium]